MNQDQNQRGQSQAPKQIESRTSKSNAKPCARKHAPPGSRTTHLLIMNGITSTRLNQHVKLSLLVLAKHLLAIFPVPTDELVRRSIEKFERAEDLA
jgi:hypothetical protein